MRILCFFIGILLVSSCAKDPKKKALSQMKISFEVVPFHKHFYDPKDSLPLYELQKKYPYLFPNNRSDDFWRSKRNDTISRRLYQISKTVFGDLTTAQKSLKILFKNIKYYHKNFTPPKVFTMVSDLDKTSKVIFADSLLFVSLDMYLGENQPFYDEFESYFRREFTPAHFIVDTAREMSQRFFTVRTSGRSFLDQMTIDQYS